MFVTPNVPKLFFNNSRLRVMQELKSTRFICQLPIEEMFNRIKRNDKKRQPFDVHPSKGDVSGDRHRSPQEVKPVRRDQSRVGGRSSQLFAWILCLAKRNPETPLLVLCGPSLDFPLLSALKLNLYTCFG